MRNGHIDNLRDFADLFHTSMFMEAFVWLRANSHPLPRMESYPIIGEDVYAKVIEYIPEPIDSGKLETHHGYVDLQVCIGPDPEKIMFANARDLSRIEDIVERDVTFYAMPTEYLGSIILEPREFVIFDVETDAHMPQRIVNPTAAPDKQLLGKNLKVVIKLRKSALTPGLKL